jgi:hypothetical protein
VIGPQGLQRCNSKVPCDTKTNGTGGPQDPDVLYEPDDVGNWLRDVEVLRAEHVIRTLDTETGLRQAIDTLVLARRKGE